MTLGLKGHSYFHLRVVLDQPSWKALLVEGSEQTSFLCVCNHCGFCHRAAWIDNVVTNETPWVISSFLRLGINQQLVVDTWAQTKGLLKFQKTVISFEFVTREGDRKLVEACNL